MTLTIVGLGELLWDFLPSGKQLGGAPANFAHSAALLGNQSTIASRIGTDSLGDEAISILAEASLSTTDLQRDAERPTGSVKVALDKTGQPQYAITESVAWDFLQWTPAWRTLAQHTDAVCFGSLAQRSSQSRQTIRNFLRAMRPETARVFDVNLRQSFYSEEVIRESMALANIVKLNDQELPIVAKLLNLRVEDEESLALSVRRAFSLDLICVTRGERGSLLMTVNESQQHAGFKVRVADTVGAGDAFTAGLIHQYLKNTSLREMNDLANRMGAWVSTQNGAMPRPATKLENILSEL